VLDDLRDRALPKGERPVPDLRDALDRCDQLRQAPGPRRRKSDVIASVPIQPLAVPAIEQLQERRDHPQRLAQPVRDRGCELFQLGVGCRQLLGQRAQPGLRAFLLGDVDRGAEETHRAAARVPQDPTPGRYPAIGYPGADHAVLDPVLPVGAGRQGSGDLPLDERAVIGVDVNQERLEAHRLVRSQLHERTAPLRPAQLVGDEVHVPDSEVGRFDRKAQVFLALDQGALVAHLPADVDRDHQTCRLPLESDRLAVNFGIDHLTVLQPVPPSERLPSGVALPGEGLDMADEARDVFLRPDLGDRHRQKFLARVAVVLDGGVVDLHESQIGETENPHRQRVCREKQTKRLGLPNVICPIASFSDGGNTLPFPSNGESIGY
jgi:hypothetical protein